MKKVDIEIIRKKVILDEYSITTHALTEARKDGIAPEDVESAILNGKIIEDYPHRYRCLIYGVSSNATPIHVVCEYYDYFQDEKDDIVVITTYFPDDRDWIKGQIRKKKKVI
ncbi:MAG: DUF4258 domain-containing protein [bacterium]